MDERHKLSVTPPDEGASIGLVDSAWAAHPTPSGPGGYNVVPLGVPDLPPASSAGSPLQYRHLRQHQRHPVVRRRASVEPARHNPYPYHEGASPDHRGGSPGALAMPYLPHLEEEGTAITRGMRRAETAVKYLFPLALVFLAMYTVEHSGRLRCWIGVEPRGWGSMVAQEEMDRIGMDLCDYRGDVREVVGAVIRTLAQDAVMSHPGSRPPSKQELESRMEQAFYGYPTSTRPASGKKLLRAPRRLFWVVLDEALKSSPFILFADGVPRINSPSLTGYEAVLLYYSWTTYVSLFSSFVASALLHISGAAAAVWFFCWCWRIPFAMQQRRAKLAGDVAQAAYEILQKKKPGACTFLELRRLCFESLKESVSRKDIESVWPCPGDADSPVERALREDYAMLQVRTISGADPTELISVWGAEGHSPYTEATPSSLASSVLRSGRGGGRRIR